MTGGNAPRYISHAERWRAQEARSTFVANDCTLGRQRMPAGTVSTVYPTCTNLMYIFRPRGRISLPILYCNAYHVPSTSSVTTSIQTPTTNARADARLYMPEKLFLPYMLISNVDSSSIPCSNCDCPCNYKIGDRATFETRL